MQNTVLIETTITSTPLAPYASLSRATRELTSAGRVLENADDIGEWLDVDLLDDEGEKRTPPDIFAVGFQEVLVCYSQFFFLYTWVLSNFYVNKRLNWYFYILSVRYWAVFFGRVRLRWDKERVCGAKVVFRTWLTQWGHRSIQSFESLLYFIRYLVKKNDLLSLDIYLFLCCTVHQQQ